MFLPEGYYTFIDAAGVLAFFKEIEADLELESDFRGKEEGAIILLGRALAAEQLSAMGLVKENHSQWLTPEPGELIEMPGRCWRTPCARERVLNGEPLWVGECTVTPIISVEQFLTWKAGLLKNWEARLRLAGSAANKDDGAPTPAMSPPEAPREAGEEEVPALPNDNPLTVWLNGFARGFMARNRTPTSRDTAWEECHEHMGATWRSFLGAWNALPTDLKNPPRTPRKVNGEDIGVSAH